MTRPPENLADPRLRGPLARDVGGCNAILAHARATRQRDLAALLRFAAGRRLGRQRDVHVAAPAHAAAAADPAFLPKRDLRPDSGGRLLARSALTDHQLRLMLTRPPGFQYRPGQHVKMGVPGLLRNYSLVSAPHQDHLEFFVELFEGGRLSDQLRTLSPGTAMALGGRARGDLRVDEQRANQLLIATVTGIAPYVSFVRDHLHRVGTRGGRRFIVLHGASHADELGYADELSRLADRHPQVLVYLPTVSRPESPRNTGWRGAHGRVEAHAGPLTSRLGLTPQDTAVFACGNSGMVRNMAGEFRRRGFTTRTESFD